MAERTQRKVFKRVWFLSMILGSHANPRVADLGWSWSGAGQHGAQE